MVTNCVEQITKEKVNRVNFTKEYILYSTDTLLRRFNTNNSIIIGEAQKDEGLSGMRVEDNDIYVYSYKGAFYSQIVKINIDGKVIKKITGNF